MNRLRRIAPYSFVVTILWIGFLLAISWMETPLRFQPEQISVLEALSIGRLVFHALNVVEIICCVMLLILSLVNLRQSRNLKMVFGCVIVCLVVQTILLFGVLDSRTEAMLRGEDVPASSWHGVYIGIDLLKLIGLIAMASLQIRAFRNDLVSSAKS